MAKFASWLVATSIVVLPAISAIFGWVASRADLVFLLVTLFAFGSISLWCYLAPRFDQTQDSLLSSLVYWQLCVSLIITVFLAPIVVLLTGIVWYWVALAAMAIMLCAEVVSALQLHYS